MKRFDAPAETIRVSESETFAIALSANPTTGYTWEANVDSRLLHVVDEGFEPGIQAVGAGGKQVFYLRARASGETEVVCQYRRPWERESRETKKFRVSIR
jgi:inhibitor of cysteine peptidase